MKRSGGHSHPWANSVVFLQKALQDDEATSGGGRVADRWRWTSANLRTVIDLPSAPRWRMETDNCIQIGLSSTNPGLVYISTNSHQHGSSRHVLQDWLYMSDSDVYLNLAQVDLEPAQL